MFEKMLEAIKKDNVVELKRLLESGAEINAVDQRGRTAVTRGAGPRWRNPRVPANRRRLSCCCNIMRIWKFETMTEKRP